jgi:hypothetical protein
MGGWRVQVLQLGPAAGGSESAGGGQSWYVSGHEERTLRGHFARLVCVWRSLQRRRGSIAAGSDSLLKSRSPSRPGMPMHMPASFECAQQSGWAVAGGEAGGETGSDTSLASG